MNIHDQSHSSCQCEYCQKIIPMMQQIIKVIPTEELRKDFDWLMERLMYAEDDRDYYKAKMEGSWPGWEWMKDYKGEPMVNREVLEGTLTALEKCHSAMRCCHMYDYCEEGSVIVARQELERTNPLKSNE